MAYVIIIFVLLASIALGVIAVLLAAWANALARELQAKKAEIGALQRQIFACNRQVQSLEASILTLTTKLDRASTEDQKKVGWLDHQQQEIAWLRAELEKRPKVTRKTYKILTLGVTEAEHLPYPQMG
jgi:peptidoglycan hydrolase CwlO-like protein